MIQRTIKDKIESLFFKGKAIIVLGPRQTGKTTLITEILKEREYLFLNADEAIVRTQLQVPDSFTLSRIIGNHTIVFIDEVQRLEEPGLIMKIITDQFKKVQLLVSGSSALEISNRINEPLTGRKWEFHLYPISFEEFENSVGYIQAENQLSHRLIFGMYPDVIKSPGNESMVLQQLTSSYLYKDLLSLANIRKPELLERLLQALALQLGNEVSYNELAQLLQVDKATVMTYIDLLEKSFIVFRLRSFSRNIRNEIKNNRKIYFWDNGVRNTIIANLNSIDLRQDKGALWENFLMSERLKYLSYHQIITNSYFWRTTQQQEIDYIEERNGKLFAYEFKWKSEGKEKTPNSFQKTYQTSVTTISRTNFRDFILPSFNS
jgi:predicted AAA+ superfamily ATPase